MSVFLVCVFYCLLASELFLARDSSSGSGVKKSVIPFYHLIMETVENNKKVVITKKAPTAAQIARAKSRRDHVLRQMRKEKRFMLLSAVVAGGAIFIWIVAIATDWWYFTEGVGHSGLWRSCFVQNSGGGGEGRFLFFIFPWKLK